MSRLNTRRLSTMKTLTLFLFSFIIIQRLSAQDRIKPVVNSITPDIATTGTTVVIRGLGLSTAKTIAFGGKTASFKVFGDTLINAVVGSGATGKLIVTTQWGADSTKNFTFLTPPPVITSFLPKSAAKGDTVTITGTNFINITDVFLGNSPGGAFTVVSPTSIKAIVPANAVSGDVFVYSTNGADTLAGFKFIPVSPIALSFTPKTAAAGTLITISGANLSRTSKVSIGGVTVPFTIKGSNVTATVPNYVLDSSVIVYSSTVIYTGTGFALLPPTPAVAAVTPDRATTGGTVAIKGTNFKNITAVRFGGVSAASFNVLSDTLINAVVGNGASGRVAVVNAGGIDTTRSFTFLPPAPPPHITSFNPVMGGDGDTITITGTNFVDITSIHVGSGPEVAYTVVSPDTIKAVVGANNNSGTVNVFTIHGGDTLAGFVYGYRIPHIASFTPAQATTGDTVLITGTNLELTTSVAFGKYPNVAEAAAFSIVSPTAIKARVGKGASGQVWLRSVHGNDSLSGFTFVPPVVPPAITSFSPAFGIAGDSVTITGTDFKNVASVFVGNGSGSQSGFKVISSTTIRAVVAVHAGSGRVIVNTAQGADTADAVFTVGLPAPVITDFTPKKALTEDTITIVGQNFRKITKVSIGSGLKTTWFTVVSPTTIKAVVNEKYDGSVYVTGQYGADTLDGFAYALPVPHITSFSPKAAVAGTIIRINGAHLADVTEVRLFGVSVPFTIIDSTALTATMPDYTPDTTYHIAVVTPTEVSYAQGLILLQTAPPVIRAFAPAEGKKGDVITISGSGFAMNTITAITFGGGAAASFQVISDSAISAVVGDDTSGYVAVATPYTIDSIAGFSFINKGVFNLINFRAQQTGEYADFSWQTNGEQFTTSFVLECTVGTRKTETTIPASGASNTVMSYGASLRLSKEATNIFRLRMVDAFGNKTYSDSLQLRIDGTTNGVLGAHPNPSRNYVIFDLPASSGPGTLWIYSTSGQLMYTTTTIAGSTAATVYLRPTPLPAGIYRVVWSDGVLSRTTTIVLQ